MPRHVVSDVSGIWYAAANAPEKVGTNCAHFVPTAQFVPTFSGASAAAYEMPQIRCLGDCPQCD
jgi:hypothetical protein